MKDKEPVKMTRSELKEFILTMPDGVLASVEVLEDEDESEEE